MSDFLFVITNCRDCRFDYGKGSVNRSLVIERKAYLYSLKVSVKLTLSDAFFVGDDGIPVLFKCPYCANKKVLPGKNSLDAVNKELAAELLKYLMDRDIQKSTVKFGGVPCRYSSLRDPEILKDFPQYKVVCEALEGGVYRPVIEEWTEFYTILGREMGSIINGVKDLDKGLDDAQKQLEQLMQ